jgi:hypothetical protein
LVDDAKPRLRNSAAGASTSKISLQFSIRELGVDARSFRTPGSRKQLKIRIDRGLIFKRN